MTITSKIILDSISPLGVRLTTFQLRYPRFIHAEELTHRILDSQPELLFYEAIPDGLMYDQDLSRNASSSRAIPVKRLIEDLRRDPAMPIYWGSNKPGMQAGEELTGLDLEDSKRHWLDAMEMMIRKAEIMMELGNHKQIVNRLLEPWAHINVVVTAVQWGNFFALRSHPDAQPEIKLLSDQMQSAMHCSKPSLIENGQWHLPYVLGSDWEALRAFAKKNRITRDEPQYEELAKLALMVSVARCARVSYKTHDGRETTVEEDMELAHKLVIATPLHASPAEHQATPDDQMTVEIEKHLDNEGASEHLGVEDVWHNPQLHGNLKGWKQHRKMLPNEFVPG